MRSTSAVSAVLVALVALWFLGAVVIWATETLVAGAALVATVVLLAALAVSVGVGVRFRVRETTPYW